MVNFRELAKECRKRAKDREERANNAPRGAHWKWYLYGEAHAYSFISKQIESNLLIFPLDPEDEEETGLEPEEVLKDVEGGKE